MRKCILSVTAIVLIILCLNGRLLADIVEIESDYYQADAVAVHVHRPYAKREYNWPESKSGKIIFQTNNLGFREDTDTAARKTKGVTRVLVTGDSQVDGVVNNSESFPSVLENRLNSESQTKKFEFLNGGVGYYGPDHYPLFLNKYLYLKPDIYIVCIYTGNDFIDSARILEARDGVNERPAEYIRSLQACQVNEGAVSQVVNQVYYFKTFPQMKEKTLNHVQELMVKIRNVCKQQGIDLLLVLLPTKADVEWQRDAEALEKVKHCLKLSEADLRINRDLTEAFIKGLQNKNINVLDLYSSMKNKNDEFYWKKDYHLNGRGHNFIAGKVYSKCRGIFSLNKH